MKIAILGTSNSVMKRSYVDALSIDNEILNFSLGMSPVFYQISKIIKEKTQIEQSDVLIIDQYINDINFYNKAEVNDYRIHIETIIRKTNE